MLSIQLNNRKVQREIQQIGSRANKLAREFLNNQTIDVIRTSKDVVPVKTGQLQTSIRSKGGGMKYVVEPNTVYAKFVHDGTSRMAGRPFMTWAYDKQKPVFDREARELLERIVR